MQKNKKNNVVLQVLIVAFLSWLLYRVYTYKVKKEAENKDVVANVNLKGANHYGLHKLVKGDPLSSRVLTISGNGLQVEPEKKKFDVWV